MLKRFKRTTVVAAGIVGLLTAVSMAFFVGSFLAEGEHTGTAGSGGTGKQTLAVNVNFPSGELTPTHAVPLTAEVVNPTNKAVTFGGIHPTITTGVAGCEASWFHVKGTGEKAAMWTGVMENKMPIEATYAPGTDALVTSANTSLVLELEETGTNQEKCESAPVTVKFKLNE
jgi:hypothetical protein